MKLSVDQCQHLREQGYVIIPGVVPRPQIDRALRAINASLGMGIDPAQLAIFQARSFCPELVFTPTITGLLNDSPALALAESLIGAGRIEQLGGGQIPLRFPTTADGDRPSGPHLDGMATKDNGGTFGTLESFTALACVLLSDQSQPDGGNFTVWPGSHLRHAQYLRAHGMQTLITSGRPALDLGPGVQVTGRPGDFVICHYLLAHAGGLNRSPHLRYSVFFRLREVAHLQRQEAALLDPWLEWPGLARTPA